MIFRLAQGFQADECRPRRPAMHDPRDLNAILRRWSSARPGCATMAGSTSPTSTERRATTSASTNWEWPQGVGLLRHCASLARHGRRRSPPDSRRLVRRTPEARSAGAQCEHHAPMLALSLLWARTRDPRWPSALEWLGRPGHRDMPRTEEDGLQHDASDRTNDGELLGRHALHGGPVPGGLRRSVGSPRPRGRGGAPVPRACPLSLRSADRAMVSTAGRSRAVTTLPAPDGPAATPGSLPGWWICRTSARCRLRSRDFCAAF